MPRAARWVFPLLLLFAAVVFLSGINWGLPSRLADPFLFGEQEPWDGKKILELAGGWDGNGAPGADMDANPLTGRDQPIILNATDAQRAEIVGRYRLYSYQPDEMNTLKALARMHPGAFDLDPRLYQYGGLWFYPLGAMLKVAGLLHLIDLRSGPDGLAYYLDHPEAFGRFYIIARLYSVFWGLIGVWAIWRIAWRLTKSLHLTAAGVICFVMMPIVVNMSHEAKPHLGGVVLCLLTALAAARFVETGKQRWWVAAGALCGASLGMVLTMLPVFAILPVMVLLRIRARWKKRAEVLLASTAVGIATYAITNPYVVLHLFRDRPLLYANLGNTATNMYVAPSWAGVKNALWLAHEGSSGLEIIGALCGVMVLVVAFSELYRGGRRAFFEATGFLVPAPALLVAVQAALFATGKPAEFGRFLLLPDIALMLAVIWGLSDEICENFYQRSRRGLIIFSAGITVFTGSMYLQNFVRDSRPWTPRLAEAVHLRAIVKERALASPTIGIPAEPAPYNLPPIDLFTSNLVLLPRDSDDRRAAEIADFVVEPVDHAGESNPNSPLQDIQVAAEARGTRTPISWAAKSFRIRAKRLQLGS